MYAPLLLLSVKPIGIAQSASGLAAIPLTSPVFCTGAFDCTFPPICQVLARLICDLSNLRTMYMAVIMCEKGVRQIVHKTYSRYFTVGTWRLSYHMENDPLQVASPKVDHRNLKTRRILYYLSWSRAFTEWSSVALMGFVAIFRLISVLFFNSARATGPMSSTLAPRETVVVPNLPAR